MNSSFDSYLGNRARRRLMRAVPGSLAWALAGGLVGGGRMASAQPLPAEGVPVVDRVAIRVVTDSYHHAFETSRTVGDVRIQRVGTTLSKAAGPRTLQNEWGLSLHLESARGAEVRQVLIDFGFTAATLNANLDILGIDPARLDALVLSHGHYDHFGGLVGFLEAHRSRLKPDLPFVLGGEECFCTREGGIGENTGSFGSLDRQAITGAKLAVRFAERPSLIAGHAFTTGQIPVETFERVLSPTRMGVGVKDGVGCYPEQLPEAKRGATALVPDDFQHEQATAFVVKDKGLVVLTSCGHRGVVNSVRTAQKVSGVNKVHAILGGFHLAPHPPEYLRQTAEAIKALQPDWLVPMHCSGEPFIAIAQQVLGDRLLRSSTGTRFSFGATA
jgi:7,8-dihydropterin-6-yl-methyl-4-(beta-D-ribofuranosyl)aminobenzene 5'-phosphate synthase